MNAVVFYSNTDQSASIAEYFSKSLGYPLVNITQARTINYENLVLVFPVYCQNIPYTVRTFLKNIKVKHLTAIATYGKMCCGNVLYEIQKNFRMNIVAGAYVPSKHSYLDNDRAFLDFERLTPVVKKVKKPSEIQVPKLYKNPLANLFPTIRSRLGVKIFKNSNCTNCGTCTACCNFKAIKSGVVNKNCIRCLNCVSSCPHNALKAKFRLPLRLYFKKNRTNKLIIYV